MKKPLKSYLKWVYTVALTVWQSDLHIATSHPSPMRGIVAS